MKTRFLFFLLSVMIHFGLRSQISSGLTSIQNVNCTYLCNGSITYTATGGILPYGIHLDGPVGGNISANQITDLCAGDYTLVITDNSMTESDSLFFSITEPLQQLYVLDVQIANNYCPLSCISQIFITPSGGSGPYTYSWTPSVSTVSYAQNLCPGDYTITVTDSLGCTATQYTTVAIQQDLFVTLNYTNTTCSGSCDGVIAPYMHGGVFSYNFNLSNSGNFISMSILDQNNALANGLCAGHYVFEGSDNNGCVVRDSIDIISGSNNITGATASLTPTKESCINSGDGAMGLSINGSNPGPYSYQWNNGATTQSIANLTSGTYSVTIFDAGMNCMVLTDSVITDTTNCATITGNVYIDNNYDCMLNTGDSTYSNAVVIVNPGNRIGYTNANGDYTINHLPYSTYSVSLNTGSWNLISTCTTTLTTSVSSLSPVSVNNDFFASFNSSTQPDINVGAWNTGIVPGFVCRMNYGLYNANNVNGTGAYKVTLPSSFIPNITTVSPAVYTISGDTVIWNFSNITVYNSGNFYIDFTVPLSTPLGSTFTSCSNATTTVTDFDPSNNSFCYDQTVTGSFDPNDKTVSPAGIGATGDIPASVNDLTYLIRFQNTGNGPAVNIFVMDTLSPNVLASSFEMLSASHDYNIEVLPGNVLKWKFNNIMLPDSNHNEPGSHGYIQYRIKRSSNNTPGTQIRNTAYIYFDFNEPVITNTALNTIETITNIKSRVGNDNEWNIFPNPSNGTIYISTNSIVKEEFQVMVVNTMGQTVHEETINRNYKTLDLSKLNNGVYFIKVASGSKSTVKRIVLNK
jgi:uncharacterized repeat protein (TIGR01451 family)